MCFVILCICKQAKIRAGVQVKESKESMTAGKRAKKNNYKIIVEIFALQFYALLTSDSLPPWLQLVASYRLIFHQTTWIMRSLTQTMKPSGKIRMRWWRLQIPHPCLLHNWCCGVALLHWSWCLSLELGSLLTKLLLKCLNNQVYSRSWLFACMAANTSGMTYVEMFAVNFIFMWYQMNWSGAKMHSI